MHALLDELRDALTEASDKVSVGTFGSRVKDAIKKLTKKRTVYVTRKEAATVSASTHAPEFDNFDYSYYLQLDIPSGRTFDLRQGMKPGDPDKVVPLTTTQAVVTGDRHSGYTNIYAHPSATL